MPMTAAHCGVALELSVSVVLRVMLCFKNLTMWVEISTANKRKLQVEICTFLYIIGVYHHSIILFTCNNSNHCCDVYVRLYGR